MSLDLGTMYASVVLNDEEYRKKLSGMENDSDKTFKKIAAAAAMYLSFRAVTSFVQGTVGVFSDLEEETNKFNVVFAGLGNQTSAILKQMREEFGLSELAAKRMLAGTGDILTGFGFDRDTALALSEGAAKLGADIASFSNYAGGAAGATNALTKAMLGETESAKLLGVVIRQDSEEYKALIKQAMTTGITIDALGKTFKVSSEQQAKAVAALALAYQQSPNAIGDFKRSMDSIANQTRILENNIEELKSSIGEQLSSAYSTALQLMNKMLTGYNSLSPATKTLVTHVLGLSAAIALLGKAGIISKANSVLASMKNFTKNAREATANAQKTRAVEEMKRAQSAMTTAQMERDLAKQNLAFARHNTMLAEAAKKNAELALAEAQRSGNAAKIAAAQALLLKTTSSVTAAKLAESKASAELTAKTEVLNIATANYNTVCNNLPGLLSSLSQASTLGGQALLFLRGGFTSVKAAANGFAASLGPVGAALLGISIAYAGLQAAVAYYTQELEANLSLTEKKLSDAEKTAAAHKMEAVAAERAKERLIELSKYERLNSAEKKEAQALIDMLSKTYGKLNITIDAATGKLNIAAGAWDNMTEAQKRNAKLDLLKLQNTYLDRSHAMMDGLLEKTKSWLNYFMYGAQYAVLPVLLLSKLTGKKFSDTNEVQKEIEKARQLKTIEEQIVAFEKIANMLSKKGKSAEAAYALQIVEYLKKQLELKKKLEEANKKDNEKNKDGKKGGKKDGKTPEELAAAEAKSKQLREELNRLSEREWQIKFDQSDSETQVEMIKHKIEKIFKESASGKFKSVEDFLSADRSKLQTAEEVRALQQILELRNKYNSIIKEGNNELTRYEEDFNSFLERRKRKAEERLINENAKRLNESGAGNLLLEFYEKNLNRAIEKLNKSQETVRRLLDKAKANNGVLSESEKKELERARKVMSQNSSDVDRWQSRVDTQRNNDKNMRNSVSAWTLEILSAKLAVHRPEKEIARNTKQINEILLRMENELKEDDAAGGGIGRFF